MTKMFGCIYVLDFEAFEADCKYVIPLSEKLLSVRRVTDKE
jgi:hypothetical protein